MKVFFILVLGGFLSMTALASEAGEDLIKAPPSFTSGGRKIVPVDIEHQTLQLTFDVASKKATGISEISFYVKEAGFPMLDLVAPVKSVTLDGVVLGDPSFDLVSAPTNATSVNVIGKEVEADSFHVVKIEYEMSDENLTFSSTGVRIGFFMSDVGDDRAFLEQYAPSNFEFDQFQMDMNVKLVGATKEHQMFTNGRAVKMGPSQWAISFPTYFTTSSFYFHLTDSMIVAEEVFQGLEKNIPVTVYSTSSSNTSQGMAKAKSVLKELEGTYGPFAHDRVVIYIAGSGGMEHCGATMTSLSALGHELTHSYFARGVMPANGNAGWIDEAVASWRDDGYPTANSEPNRPAVSLANFSPYRRHTPMAAYDEGAQFMSEMDYMFRNKDGLKGVLRELFKQYKRTTITTPMLATFFESQSGQSLSKYFDRYVYGKSLLRDEVDVKPFVPRGTYHPRPYTREELKQLR